MPQFQPLVYLVSWCLWLVSALQGYEINSEDRRKLVDDIEQMSYDGQETLIEFLETGVAPSTLENNACKQFVCNTTELPIVFESKDPQSSNFRSCWSSGNNSIIKHCLPFKVYFIRYSSIFQRARPEFDIRRTILTIFRDRVLTKVLQNVNQRIPILEPMLFTVLLETDNVGNDSADFTAIAQRVMGTKQVLLRSLRFSCVSVLKYKPFVISEPETRAYGEDPVPDVAQQADKKGDMGRHAEISHVQHVIPVEQITRPSGRVLLVVLPLPLAAYITQLRPLQYRCLAMCIL
ncbi:hypothetical protein ANCDUO_11804 [Ancylostoma duodenale]|uniref:Uncharacterized protein n=1 Tax=Ancylostoma duodenale TaxID=51022 RepID=A0A0C2GLQ3_9BILA|nr:hypothetical protein ANCDUO_11804 [Ancylostoma duodenale]